MQQAQTLKSGALPKKSEAAELQTLKSGALPEKSEAAKLVEKAAAKIPGCITPIRLKALLLQMTHHGISDKEQLLLIEPTEWRELKATIGLRTSIHILMNEDEQSSEDKDNGSLEGGGDESGAGRNDNDDNGDTAEAETAVNRGTIGANEGNGNTTIQRVSKHSQTCQKKCVSITCRKMRKICSFRRCRTGLASFLQDLLQVLIVPKVYFIPSKEIREKLPISRDYIRFLPVVFVFGKKYLQAVIHSNTGEELKKIYEDAFNQASVASSLFVAASVSMWGAFSWEPSEHGISDGLVLAFNSTIFATTILWTGVFLLTTVARGQGLAVKPDQFKQFAFLNMNGLIYLWAILQLAIATFCVSVLILFVARQIEISEKNSTTRRVITITVPLLLFFWCALPSHLCINCATRISYHSGLMVDKLQWDHHHEHKHHSDNSKTVESEEDAMIQDIVSRIVNSDDGALNRHIASSSEHK